MNQSNNQERQNVRMITPEQVSSQTQKEFMSQEELQRTQVLNLKDVQETVKYEKLHSKKPAIIVAIIGIVCLSIGSSFAFIQSMSARKAAKDAKIESRKATPEKSDLTSLVCSLESLNEPDGTGKTMVYTYVFKSNKLKSFTKAYSMIPTVPGSEQSGQTVQSFINALQSFLVTIDGYKLTVAPESTGGVITTTEVNFDLLDITQVPAANQSNFRFNIPYEAQTDLSAIKADMTKQGFKCQ